MNLGLFEILDRKNHRNKKKVRIEIVCFSNPTENERMSSLIAPHKPKMSNTLLFFFMKLTIVMKSYENFSIIYL